MKDEKRYRRLSIYLLLLVLLVVLAMTLTGPNFPLLLVTVFGLGSLTVLLYVSYRRDLRNK